MYFQIHNKHGDQFKLSNFIHKEINKCIRKMDQNKRSKHANRSVETSNAQLPKSFVRCFQDLRVPFEDEKMAIEQLPKFFSLCITPLIL